MKRVRGWFARRPQRQRFGERDTVMQDRGATATEYAVLVGVIVLIVAVGVTAFGTALRGGYNVLETSLSGWLN